MSALLETILADIKTAMKARDKIALTTLRMLHSELKNVGVNAGKELSDDDVVQIVGKAIKQRRDAAQQFRDGDRAELADKEEAEIAVLEKYLPAQLDRDAIVELARSAIEESGAQGKKDMGKVMGLLMPKVKGKADGKLVNQVVVELLAEG